MQNARNENRQQEWESNWKQLYEEDIKKRLSESTCKQDACSCGGTGTPVEYSHVKGHVNVNKPAAMHGYGEVLAALNTCKPICQAAVNKTSPSKERKVIKKDAILKALMGMKDMTEAEAQKIISEALGA
jgi:hypothetical protein